MIKTWNDFFNKQLNIECGIHQLIKSCGSQNVFSTSIHNSGYAVVLFVYLSRLSIKLNDYRYVK